MGGARVLVIDEGSAAAVAASRVVGDGVEVRHERSLAGGLAAVGEEAWTATLFSLDVPGASLELVERLLADGSSGGMILLTERASPVIAMAATKLGVVEVLTHPIDEGLLRAALGGMEAPGAGVRLQSPAEAGALVGASPALLEVFKSVGRVAGSGATVLVTGESGTGKELVAHAIHDLSPRAKRPFVAVNCAAIPEDLLESELFGHERGAFTGAVARKIGRFERASGGTLFLDEIGDMSMVLQAKILRALQERVIERLGGEETIAVDVRVVAATHRDLSARIATGEFREDLYYRLAVVRLHLPPLRERREDVRELTLHYAARLAAEHGRALRVVSEAALRALEQHVWPGNVRELRNVIERAVLTSRGEELRLADIDLDDPRTGVAAPEADDGAAGYSPDLSLADVEALHMARVLESVGGQFSRAAEILGVHRNTVARKARQYGLSGE